MKIEIGRALMPIKTISASNSRESWRARARRVKYERAAAYFLCRRLTVEMLPCSIKLTRVAPRALDDDNLRGALKAVRDGIADRLGIQDNDPRVEWEYGQRRGEPRDYAVEAVCMRVVGPE